MMKRMSMWAVLTAVVWGCGGDPIVTTEAPHSEVQARKTAVLLVNHGSHSETWRTELLDLERRVKDPILEDGSVLEVRTAFMEYNEPSIATRLEEYDQEGYTDIILVPVFLAVSTHSFDDIPTIIGKKTDPVSLESLKVENIKRYTPKAEVHITPLLDFSDILKKNIVRRVKELSKAPEAEGLVLIAYGDETYEKEWTALLSDVGAFVEEQVGIDSFSVGWCGHLVHYDSQKTVDAIDEVLKHEETALVVPVLVAHDENFQVKIIGGGVEQVERSTERVVYRPDSILPDPNVDQWVVEVVREFSAKLGA